MIRLRFRNSLVNAVVHSNLHVYGAPVEVSPSNVCSTTMMSTSSPIGRAPAPCKKDEAGARTGGAEFSGSTYSTFLQVKVGFTALTIYKMKPLHPAEGAGPGAMLERPVISKAKCENIIETSMSMIKAKGRVGL